LAGKKLFSKMEKSESEKNTGARDV